ncbi:NPCBM-associated, NEW3 domain of alpha-galactosidase [Bacillus sp. OV322]|uniref:NEW3 domain-containing protein n=1 Tax=Bacillus sp. OV322 TaxID=1882764 RepID=UPI0008E5C1F1|nr:NEW3 domain-containing protein [Bacillus sp. OV322]SFC51646.1 NPCBM-associated, NEW3 domain of alpha-galactosidase [Bacillus sp. OV322]
MKRILFSFLSILLCVSFFPIEGIAAPAKEPDVALWNAVKPLGTTVSFLNTGAHPDDERSDFLAYLSRGLGVKTSSLIANRGEGGQNEIGDELGNALGIIRSREMIEAAKITGVTAYHLSRTTSDPIYDFGFSKTPEETLSKWGETLTYERVIRFIRTYQPDIAMPSFRNDDTQHGHHRTMEILTERAFKDAADPKVFPNQLKEGLSVWQIKKLYLPAASKESAATSIEIGKYDPVYKMTYPQLGEQSRFMHKSQGMGSVIPAEPRQVDLELLKSAVGDNKDLFAGVPYDLKQWAKKLPKKEQALKNQFTALQSDLNSAISSYPNRSKVFDKSQQALKEVRSALAKTKRASLDSALKADLLHKLSLKEDQLQNASFVSSSLSVTAKATSNILTKGQKTTVTVKLVNNGKHTITNAGASLIIPKGWKAATHNQNKTLKPGRTASFTYNITVPKNAAYYDPYQAPAIQAKINYKAKGTAASHVQDLEGTIAVLPEVGLTLSPDNLVVNTLEVQKEIPVTVKAKNYQSGAAKTAVSLHIPKGWKVSPQKAVLSFKKKLEEQDVTFKLSPPAGIKAGDYSIDAIAERNGQKLGSTIQEISYNHIGTFYYQYPAKLKAVAFELNKPKNLNVGYVDSGFDKVADSLIQAGFHVTKLTEADLSTGDLSKYDTIVTGIRAYLSRADLLKNNARLLQYAENGGHVVVQYHKPGDKWDPAATAPYKLKIGDPSIRWRVTDENAKVTVTNPNSPLFSYPNKITDKDWENWIQERGLYYPMEWDSRYETFVSMADPNEAPFTGGILAANYGKGTYLYTSLVFYRQIQSQVPGAYRIFTNMISYGTNK